MRDEVFKDCYNEYINAQGPTSYWPELANKWGYEDGESLRGAFKRERMRRNIPSKSEPTNQNNSTYKESDKSIHITCASERIKTRNDVISEFDIDMDRWEVEFFELKTSEGYRKDRKVEWDVTDNRVTHGHVRDTGKMLVVPLYHTRTKFIRKTIQHISLEDVSRLLEEKEFSIPNIKPKNYSPSGEVLEVNIMDLHFGSDANHSPEKRLSKAIDDVVKRAGTRKFSKIYLCLLGDVFHYDNVNKTTAAGTIVTTNGMTAYEVFDLGITTLTENILKLVSIAPIEIIFVPGNHDPMNSYALTKVLEAFFKDNKKIALDADHARRKFRLIGNSLVGWMHGDMPKARAMDWLQVEAYEEWGKAKFKEIHSGNFHSQGVKEEGGVVLRYLPGMTDIDDWHYRQGFVGAVRGLLSFVWSVDGYWREQWFTSVEN